MNKEPLPKGFFTGINYWASKNAINMWDDFDEQAIDRDLELLEQAGIFLLRVFPMWHVFQPIHALYTPRGPYEYRFGEEPLPDTAAGRAGVSEEACNKFDLFCRLAQKHHMQLIVALITGHMSFRNYAPPAFAGKSLIGDPTVAKWQLRYVKYFVNRFKNKEVILSWEIGNEVTSLVSEKDFKTDAFYVWCSAVTNAVRAADPSRSVISGMHTLSIEKGLCNLKTVGEYCDVHTTHPYHIFATSQDPLASMKPILDPCFKCRITEDIGGIPAFIEEFGSIGYMNCSYETEAKFYRAALLAALSHNCRGILWWCAFDQGHLKYAPYDWNNIGSDYGFFDKALKPKPIAEENLRLKKLLSLLPGGSLPEHTVNGVVLVPRDDGDADIETLRSAYLLAKRANLDVRFSYALDPIPEAPLYIFPSLMGIQSIPQRRLDELLQRVKEGAVFYVSVGTALFRQVPEIFGIQFAQRRQIASHRIMQFRGTELCMASDTLLIPEKCDCEILAGDTAGTPMFFKRSYGKGAVYFLTAPVEKYLARKEGAFCNENEPEYDLIYRELAESAGCKRIADSSSPYIRLTEHRINEKQSYIVAINYSSDEKSTRICVDSNIKICPFWGRTPENGTLTLAGNDGAVFLAEENV